MSLVDGLEPTGAVRASVRLIFQGKLTMPLKQPSQSPASGGQRAAPDTPPQDLLDEALEETFPASDAITPARRADPKTRSDS